MATISIQKFQSYWRSVYKGELEIPFSEQLLSILFYQTDRSDTPVVKLNPFLQHPHTDLVQLVLPNDFTGYLNSLSIHVPRNKHYQHSLPHNQGVDIQWFSLTLRGQLGEQQIP